MFTSSEREADRIKEIELFEYSYQLPFRIISIDDNNKLPPKWYGGSKYFEGKVYVGAYNYLDVKEFLYHLKYKVNWEDPESVQLIVKEQDDDLFKVINLCDQ